MGRRHQTKKLLGLVGAPLAGHAVRQGDHGLVHLPAHDLELADVDVVDGHLGKALLSGWVRSRANLKEEAAGLWDVQVEVGLLSPGRHHHEPAQGELATRRFHTGAAGLEVGEGVVEADVLLAVQVQVGLALVVAVECGLDIKDIICPYLIQTDT